MLFLVFLLFTCARALFYDDYEPLGFEYFDEIENATIVDLSVNASTPYTEDRGEYRIFSSQNFHFEKVGFLKLEKFSSVWMMRNSTRT